MAHELTTRANGKTEMAFVGETPWHGLGQRVTQGASIEEWAVAAGLDWDARRAVVQYTAAIDDPVAEGQQPHMIDGRRSFRNYERQAEADHVIYRSDTGDRIGLVSNKYKIVQPREVLEFFRDLTEAGDWHIHTAGTLRGGSRIWALASNHTEGTVVPGDRVRGNLLLATSLDGSLQTIAAMTAIRVVCANTLRLALDSLPGARIGGKVSKKTKDSIAISHRSTFDPEAVKRELGVARPAFETFMNQARAMANVSIGQEEARHILRQLFERAHKPADEAVAVAGGAIDGSDFKQLLQRPHAATDAPKDHRSVDKVLELFNGAGRGANHDGVRDTRWGLFNAITEFTDHQQGRTQAGRLENAWFGKTHELKTEALRLLTDGTYAPTAN